VEIAGVIDCKGCGMRFIQSNLNRLYCTELCRKRASGRAQRARKKRSEFTDEMVAELYADALAGNIRAWHDDDEC
jgi:hypothetical protein